MFAIAVLELTAWLRAMARPVAILTAAALVAACGGGAEDGDTGQSSPIISTQPVDLSVVAGRSVDLSVIATGSAPLQYQWSSSPDGVTFTAIADGGSATYRVSDATPAQNGTRYRVVVGNAIGSATSNVVRLTVTVP